MGGGVAGLSAGCYAARCGYRTTILEMGQTPGGLCTSWRRGGYRFDGSVAGLAGTHPSLAIYRLWEELGVIDYCPLYDPDDFGSVVCSDGRLVTVYTDIARLESHLLQNFPADTMLIQEFAAALRACTKVDIAFKTDGGLRATSAGVRSTAKLLGSLPVLIKYARLTLREFCCRLTDPHCREVFNNLVHFGGPDLPLLTVLLPIAYAHRRATGVPLHGWLSFARAIERRYLELGGEIRYRAKVTGLVREDDRVSGVVLQDGSIVAGSRVMSTADGRFTHGVLLQEPKSLLAKLFDSGSLSDQPVQVNLGVRRDACEPGAITYLLPDKSFAAGRAQSRITAHTNRDPQAAPDGRAAVTVFLESGYEFWRVIADDPDSYQTEKRRCAELVIQAIESHKPNFSQSVEVVDVSTPLTRERYTGNWRGAMQAKRPDSSMIKSLLQSGPRYRYPSLEGFWMAGQWVEAWGGITTAAQSGRNAVRALCKKDGVWS